MNALGIRVFLTLATLMVAYTPDKARTAPILDQFYNPVVTTRAEVDEIVDHAQTFTVGLDGMLSHVAVLLCKGVNTTQDLLFDIRTTSGGVPVESDELGNGSVLASATVPASAVEVNAFRFIDVDITSFNLLVHSGEVLAIVLRPSEPFVVGTDDGYGWGGTLTGNRYGRGTRYSRIASLGIDWQSFPERDMAFATYIGGPGNPTLAVPQGVAPGIKTPEPDGFILLSTGIATLFIVAFPRLRRPPSLSGSSTS